MARLVYRFFVRTIEGQAIMPRWTTESRQRQSELIRTWQPWTRSTGPRTDEGKAASSMNNYRTGWYAENEGKPMLARWVKFDRHIRYVIRCMKRAKRKRK